MNIEIKARCGDPDRIRQILKTRDAEYRGTDHQVDTYFRVERGRLKLREGNIENFLIYYEREDRQGPKQSDVVLFASDPKSTLKDILMKSLSPLVVVDKTREIYFIGNVKFHIDRVADLGSFVEIEAIDLEGSIGKDRLLEQCCHYLELFSIPEQDLLTKSYSDMLLERAEKR